jgi:hypothetical protein
MRPFISRLKNETKRKNADRVDQLCDEFAKRTRKCRSGPILEQIVIKMTEIPTLIKEIKKNQSKMYQIARLGNLRIVKLTRRLEKM